MCFSGGGDGGAADAAKAEKTRQANITKGTAAINQAFDGYSTGINPVTGQPTAGTTYYLDDGTPVTVASSQVANPDYATWSAAAPNQRTTEAAPSQYITQQNLVSGGNTIGAYGSKPIYSAVQSTPGFDDAFYNGIDQSYKDYATPQLDQQYQEALKQLSYALDRKGLSASTAAGSEQAKLQQQYNTFQTDVASAGQSYADKARTDVENSRTTLENQLAATEDPVAAGQNAIRAAAIDSRPPAFDPVGTFAFNVSQGLQQQSANNGYNGLLSTSLFKGTNPSSSVTYR